jgi:YD repeat-containing protein
MRRFILVLGLLLIATCVWSSPARAQSNPCLNVTQWSSVYGAAPIGWFSYTTYPGTWAFVIAAWKYTCVPSDSASETYSCSNCQAGKPISLASGDTYITETDIRLPGLGGGLNLVRTWNSLWPSSAQAYRIGIFGPNWKSTYEERVYVGSDGYIKYARSDGSVWSFGNDGWTVWKVAAPANMSATLVQEGGWNLTFSDGEQRIFDTDTGKLYAIKDRNGNTTQLSYDLLGRLSTVTDAAGRHLYFNYGSGTYLVTSVTTDFGESTSYSYDDEGRLSQVTEPDSSTISFQYDANSFISAVLDSNGKVLESHTYDSDGRGLTSSRANGVEAVTVTY